MEIFNNQFLTIKNKYIVFDLYLLFQFLVINSIKLLVNKAKDKSMIQSLNKNLLVEQIRFRYSTKNPRPIHTKINESVSDEERKLKYYNSMLHVNKQANNQNTKPFKFKDTQSLNGSKLSQFSHRDQQKKQWNFKSVQSNKNYKETFNNKQTGNQFVLSQSKSSKLSKVTEIPLLESRYYKDFQNSCSHSLNKCELQYRTQVNNSKKLGKNRSTSKVPSNHQQYFQKLDDIQRKIKSILFHTNT